MRQWTFFKSGGSFRTPRTMLAIDLSYLLDIQTIYSCGPLHCFLVQLLLIWLVTRKVSKFWVHMIGGYAQCND